MVNQGFDSEWKIEQQLDWLQAMKGPEKYKFLAVCAYLWIGQMVGVPLTPKGK